MSKTLSALLAILGLTVIATSIGTGYIAYTRLETQWTHAQSQIGNIDQTIQVLQKTVTTMQQTFATPAVTPTVTHTYQQLVTVDRLINQLPLAVPSSSSSHHTAPAALPTDPPTQWWETAWIKTKQALQQVFVVRRISSDSFFYQYLHAQITFAIWGLLHQDTVIYDTSLTQAILWLSDYFEKDAIETKAMLAQLQALQTKR